MRGIMKQESKPNRTNPISAWAQKLAGLKKSPTALLLYLLVTLAALVTAAIVVYLIGFVLVQGIPHLITEVQKFFSGQPSLFDAKYNSDNASLVPALVNTLSITFISVAFSAVFGILTAVYLVEYSKKGNRVIEVIRITAETLSGIPSIIYGLFGSIFFVKFLGMGISLWSGIATAAIMILPLIIRSTEEALKSVPDSYREASFGLGAGKLRTIFSIVLPSAIPGILAGVILSVGRVIGETAALLYTSGTATRLATDMETGGRTLAIHMYMLTGEGMHFNQAYATAVILLVLVLSINALAGFIAKKLQKG